MVCSLTSKVKAPSRWLMTLRCRPIIVDLVQVRQYFQLTETEPQPIQTQRIKKHKVEN